MADEAKYAPILGSIKQRAFAVPCQVAFKQATDGTQPTVVTFHMYLKCIDDFQVLEALRPYVNLESVVRVVYTAQGAQHAIG